MATGVIMATSATDCTIHVWVSALYGHYDYSSGSQHWPYEHIRATDLLEWPTET